MPLKSHLEVGKIKTKTKQKIFLQSIVRKYSKPGVGN